MNEITYFKSRLRVINYLRDNLFSKLMLILMLFGTVSLNAQTQPTPWFEGFATNQVPTGWTNNGFNFGTQTYLNAANPTPSVGNYVYRNLWGSNTSFDFTTTSLGPILSGDKLSFVHKTIAWASTTDGPGAGAGDFKLKISSDGGTTYTTVATVVNTTNADWINYEYDLASYVGQTIKIQIQANLLISSADYVIGFDNFVISSGLCSLPGAPTQVSNTGNSVNLSFSGDATNNYQVQYGLPGFALGSGTTSATSTGNTLGVTGLSSSTVYHYYVRKVCASNENSPWVGPYSMITACGVVTELFQNFDSTPAGSSSNPSAPLCWTFLAPPYVDWDSGYGYTYQWTSYSAPNSFYMTNNYDTVGDFILAGPPTNNLGNGTMQLRFYAKGSWSGGNFLTVGTMSDSNNASTFTALPNGSIELTSSFAEYTVTLPAGTNDYFAFKMGVEEEYLSVYIDDVHYELIPTCLPIDFGSGTATVTDVQAVLSWGSTETNFDVEWGPVDFVQGTGTLLTNVTNNYVLQGLTQATEYAYYVRANCGAEDGTSTWRGPYEFTTQTVFPSPWFDGFANGTAPGWNNLKLDATFSLTNNTDGLTPYENYILYNNVYTESDNGSGVTTPNIGPIIAGDKLTFDSRTTMYGSPYSPVDPSAGDIEVFISSNFGQTYTSIGSIPYGEDGWQPFEYQLSSYVGQLVKIKLLVNYNYTPYPDNSPDTRVGFDNFYIGSCALPTIPQVTNTTTNSATIVWDATATDTFQIEYGLAGFVQGTGTIVSVTGNTHTINSLLTSTAYDFYIRRACGTTNNSPWFGKYKFTTSCEVFTGAFTENFDTTDTGTSTNPTVPICWTFLDGGAGYGYVSTTYSSSPSKSFYIYNSSDNANPYILVSPETNNLGSGYYRVTFKARTGTTGTQLVFGTMSNKLDASTFTALQTISLVTNFNNTYTVYLPVGTDDYFAFKHGQNATYASIYIDNVVYEPAPACAAPVNLGANKNLATLSAELVWSGPAITTSNNFEVEWGVTGFEQGDGTVVTADSYSKTISSLVLGETYSFYVRRICTEGNTDWVGPYTFEMDYCIPNSSYNEGTGMTSLVIDGNDFEFEFDDEQYNTEYLTPTAMTLTAGDVIPVEAMYNTTIYSYKTSIWIDFDNNGVFSDSERVFYAVPIEVEGVDGVTHQLPDNSSFVISDTSGLITGNYRMRIVGSETSGLLNSCSPGAWSFAIDMTVNIIFPCIQPSNISFTDIGYTYAVIDWEGQGNSDFELEYGFTGFTQGTGTVITNVTKPYTLENLTPGKTYDVYVRKLCGAVYSEWSQTSSVYIYCDAPAPTGENNQTLVQDELLSDLVIVGQNLKYYTDPGLTQEVPASFALQTSGSYFVTQTINCESDSYLLVTVNVLPRIAQPIVNTTQNFCDGGQLEDIVVTSLPNATVIWYATATSTEALPLATVLQTGTYYVVQTDGITTSHRVAVNVSVNPTPQPLIPSPIHLCGTYTFADLVVANVTGTTVKWYATADSATPIAGNAIVSTGTYYVSQGNGTCESPRVAYQVSQFEALAKPVADIQTFCGSGTVSDLVAQGVVGAQMLWFSSATSANPLPTNTVLTSGTYYVAQTINGCYSDRKAVAVRVVSLTAPQIQPFTICGSGTISDLIIASPSGVTFKWFTSPSSTEELTQVTPLSTGTYYVSRVQYGCESQRSAVQVTIGSIPSSPTGAATQTFVEGSTISNLVMNQGNVTWYITYTDAQNGTNPLASNMPLVNGTTYYAVIIGTNGCPSLPFAVTVSVYLSNNEFDMDGLKYYPNPVNDVLNVDYVEVIKSIEVFDLLGKRVKTLSTNNNNVKIDLSELASGTYMIQLKTDSKTQFIKVIKK